MSIQAINGIRAYTNALTNFTKAEQKMKDSAPAEKPSSTPFTETVRSSLGKVNDLQQQKNSMIQSFASGEIQNVHELMISLQKASLAVNMTAAVRNKVMEAYRELSRIQF